VLFGSYFSSELLVEISILFFSFERNLGSVQGVKICHGTLVLEPVFHISISRLPILGFSKNKNA